jgi:hypothetical protein
MNRKLSLVALAFSFLLGSAACGGRSAKPARGMASPSEAAPQMCRDSGDYDSEAPEPAGVDGDDQACWTPDSRDKITVLWNEIRDARVNAGMNPEPLASAASRVHSMSVKNLRDEAEHPEPKTQDCIDTCKIEDSICNNAQKICDLASELSDDWATEKCDSGKASCEEATKKCVACVDSEKPVTPAP